LAHYENNHLDDGKIMKAVVQVLAKGCGGNVDQFVEAIQIIDENSSEQGKAIMWLLEARLLPVGGEANDD